MIMKKTTVFSFALAACIVVGTTAALAVSNGEAKTELLPQNTAAFQQPTKQELIERYGAYGISFDQNGKMLFQGALVRIFWDGVKLDENMSSVAYEYFDEKGVVDVHTIRSVARNPDGSRNPFGELIGIKKESQEVFDQRDIKDYVSPSTTGTTVVYPVKDVDGQTLAERMGKYEKFGIRYEDADGLGNVYYQDTLIKTFIDENKQGDIFVLSSNDGGELIVYTEYDSAGNLVGVEVKK